jgi:hypothetical protein
VPFPARLLLPLVWKWPHAAWPARSLSRSLSARGRLLLKLLPLLLPPLVLGMPAGAADRLLGRREGSAAGRVLALALLRLLCHVSRGAPGGDAQEQDENAGQESGRRYGVSGKPYAQVLLFVQATSKSRGDCNSLAQYQHHGWECTATTRVCHTYLQRASLLRRRRRPGVHGCWFSATAARERTPLHPLLMPSRAPQMA